MTALNAEDGVWQEMPFPVDKVPEGHKVRAVQGIVKGFTFLSVEAVTERGTLYEATGVPPGIMLGASTGMSMNTMIHLPSAVAKAAFLKGIAWLEKQKPAV